MIGSSGSGKTTLARQLARILDLPLLEMDSAFHREGWDSTPEAEFRAILDEFSGGDRWVADGNYSSHGSRDLVWPRADTIVWVDPPKRVAMRRVIGRTLKRVITREKLWGEVTEPWSNLYSSDPYKNIIVWTWTQFDHVRDKYETAIGDGSWDHADVHRLRSKSDMTAFVDAIDPESSSNRR